MSLFHSWSKSFLLLTSAAYVLFLLTTISQYHSDNDLSIKCSHSRAITSPAYYLMADWTKELNASSMTPQELVEYFYWTNSTSCRLSQDFGGIFKENPGGYDGQKAICLERTVAPRPGRCLIYSIGISNEWSFDETMEDYGCEVFAFDPSMNAPDHNHSSSIHFYELGIDVKDHTEAERGWKMKTLQSVYQMLGHEGRIIDYLKMDIEAMEWAVVEEIISSGMLPKIRQMGIEFHLPENKSLDVMRSLASVIQSVEKAGMVRFDSKANLWARAHFESLNYTGPAGFDIAWYQILPF